MSQRIIDVDAAGILTTPIQAKIKDVVYKLPGDMPAPLYARLLGIAERGSSDPREIGSLYEGLLGLFQVFQPDLVDLPIGINELTAVVGFIYNNAGDTGAEVGGDPTSPAKKTTSPRRARAEKSAS